MHDIQEKIELIYTFEIIEYCIYRENNYWSDDLDIDIGQGVH